MFCENQEAFVQTLQKRGYTVHLAADGQAAAAQALALIGSGSVGCGGSKSAAAIGLYDALRKNGNTLYSHAGAAPADVPAIFAGAMAADWYVCSTNAITLDGKLVNIDGTGNRVAGMFAGPRKVLLIIGKNKLTPNLDAAFDRVKNVAAPPNAKRLGRKTPCAVTGKCADCDSPDRICKVTTIIEYKPNMTGELHLLLVDEALGF